MLVLLLLLLLLAPTLAQAPALVLQDGHTQSLTDVRYSPDGRWLATASRDGTVKIWDAEESKLRCTLALDDIPQCVAWGSRQRIAVATKSGVAVYDLNGQKLWPAKERRQTTSDYTAIAFLNDNFLLTLAHDSPLSPGTLRVLDLSTQPSGILAGWYIPDSADGLAQDPCSLAVSPDGKLLAIPIVRFWLDGRDSLTHASRAVALYDISSFQAYTGSWYKPGTGQVADGFPSAACQPVACLETPSVSSPRRDRQLGVAFSPDSKQLAMTDLENLCLWSLANPDQHTALPGVWNHLSWGAAGLMLTNTINTFEHPRLGKLENGVIKVLAGPRPRAKIDEIASSQAWDPEMQPYVNDSNGYLVLSGHPTRDRFAIANGQECELWDSLQAVRALKGRSLGMGGLAVSPDGRWLAVGGPDTVVVWDLARGKPGPRLENLGQLPLTLAFSPDSKLLAVGEYGIENPVRLRVLKMDGWQKVLEAYQTPPENVVLTGGSVLLQRPDTAYTAVIFSPDGQQLVGGTLNGGISVFDLATGKERVLRKNSDQGDKITSLAYWKGALIASEASGLLMQFDLKTGKMSTLLPGQDSVVAWACAAVSPDGQTMITSDIVRGLTLYAPRPVVLTEDWNGAQISFAGSSSLLATQQGETFLLDLKGKKLAGPFRTPGYQYISRKDVLIAFDGAASVGFWRIPSGQKLGSATLLDGGKDWLVAAPDGLFDGSSQAFTQIQWRKDGKLFALDQFYNDYFSPGLLTRLLDGTSAAPAQPLEALKAAPPEVSFVKPQAGDSVSEPTAQIELKLTDGGAGISQVRLFQNGHRVPDEKIQVDGATARATVPLEGGVNTLRATAFDSAGKVESRGDTIRVTCLAQSGKPRLHVLAVGLSNYEDARLNLKAGKGDAESIGQALKPGKLFEEVKLTLLTDQQATGPNMRAALEKLKSEAAPQDTLLVFLAGHGQVVGQTFYFVPYEGKVSDPDQIARTCISSTELAEALAHVGATRQFVVLDCCHSGAAAATMGLVRAQQDLARQSGVFLVAAAATEQSALEITKLDHGLLTYSVLTGLDQAPVNSRGMITVNGLLLFVSGEVPRLAEEYLGQPQDVVQYSSGQDFPLRQVR